MGQALFKDSPVFASFAVDNADKAMEFYGKTLGLKVKELKEMDGMFEISAPDGAKIFVYARGSDHKPANFTVLNIPVDDIEAAMKDLKSKGITFETYDGKSKESGGMKTDAQGLSRDEDTGFAIAWFKDPAGNFVSLIEE